jgi:hypothetical protein
MSKPRRLRVSLSLTTLVSALFLSLPAAAQEKSSPIRAQKILLDNERLRATEGVFTAGEANPMEPRGHRITRVLKGSTTIERTHSSGRMEKIEWKEGGVYYSPADNASSKNIGKSEVTIYTVAMKEKK